MTHVKAEASDGPFSKPQHLRGSGGKLGVPARPGSINYRGFTFPAQISPRAKDMATKLLNDQRCEFLRSLLAERPHFGFRLEWFGAGGGVSLLSHVC